MVRVNQIWVKALQAYAAAKGVTVSELVRRMIVEFERDKVSHTQCLGVPHL